MRNVIVQNGFNEIYWLRLHLEEKYQKLVEFVNHSLIEVYYLESIGENQFELKSKTIKLQKYAYLNYRFHMVDTKDCIYLNIDKIYKVIGDNIYHVVPEKEEPGKSCFTEDEAYYEEAMRELEEYLNGEYFDKALDK